MPISNFSTDYTGRLKDIHIMRGCFPEQGGIQRVTLGFGDVAAFCAGVQKLVQRYVVCLLTELGSQSDFPSFGTDFGKTVLGGGNVSMSDIKHIINLANFKVITEFKKYQANNPGLPLDEQINTASCTSIAYTNGTVSVTMALLTMAGEDVTFLLPLPVTN